MLRIEAGKLVLEVGREGELFTLQHSQDSGVFFRVGGPIFEVDGQSRTGFKFTGQVEKTSLQREATEWKLNYELLGSPTLRLTVIVRAYPTSEIVRMQYHLISTIPAHLTKLNGKDCLQYFKLKGDWFGKASMDEIQLSHFDPVAHAYQPLTIQRTAGEIFDGMKLVGPVVILHNKAQTVLAAYEHGADVPLSFFDYAIDQNEEERSLELTARQGNYFTGQPLGMENAFESVWFELGAFPGDVTDFLPRYRHFFLEEASQNLESRQPYIYYNTWNYQERQRYFKNRPYLESMVEERILAEIDVAHRMGVDVFVIDTGWYIKTGDWLPNPERFTDGLKTVKHRLDSYGMKLGLWFNPTVAALTSEIFRSHPEFEMTRQGKPAWRGPVWETEESASICLASGYADYYIETMVRLNHELGVSYFKWDGVGQYGCDSPLHHHGTVENSPEERAECYAFQMGRQMIRIVEEVSRRCPEVIVDFDITEGGRFVGLGFLSVGKYFLVNNGPYFQDFNIPDWVKMNPNTINVFFYPGAARPRICRKGANYDGIIPSILFLTHYLPDAPVNAQENSLAALVLGGNGLWGDLLSLSEDDLAYWAEHLVDYKKVAAAATRSYPCLLGFAGSSPEVHEKIDPATGSGIVVLFTVAPGEFTYLTQPLEPAKVLTVKGAESWEFYPDGRLKIKVRLERDGARVVYIFGKEG